MTISGQYIGQIYCLQVIICDNNPKNNTYVYMKWSVLVIYSKTEWQIVW